MQALPAAVSASKEGTKHPLSKPLESKRSADTLADGEVGFPMPSRPRVSMALPGDERPLRHNRHDAVDAAIGSLPDLHRLTPQV